MQQQRQVEHKRPLDLLKYLGVFVERSVRRLPNPVKLFETKQRVLISRILMIELVLDETGQLAELRNVFAEQSDFMHRPQNRGYIPTLVQDFEEGFPHVFVGQESSIDERQFVANK